MRKDVIIRRTERWFVREGVPQLIAGYGFRSHVLPRMLPFLAAVVLASVLLAVLGANARPGVGVVVAAALVVVGPARRCPGSSQRLGRQLPRLSRQGRDRRPGRLRAHAAAVAAAARRRLRTHRPGAEHRRAGHADRAGRRRAPDWCWRPSSSRVFALAWFATAYGVVALAARAIPHALSDMRGSLHLQGRALPTLLFVTFFLFFTGELWQLMNHLAWGRLVLVLALFASVTVLATVGPAARRDRSGRARPQPERLGRRLRGTPLESVAG